VELGESITILLEDSAHTLFLQVMRNPTKTIRLYSMKQNWFTNVTRMCLQRKINLSDHILQHMPFKVPPWEMIHWAQLFCYHWKHIWNSSSIIPLSTYCKFYFISKTTLSVSFELQFHLWNQEVTGGIWEVRECSQLILHREPLNRHSDVSKNTVIINHSRKYLRY
jgi:hypothetical protein